MPTVCGKKQPYLLPCALRWLMFLTQYWACHSAKFCSSRKVSPLVQWFWISSYECVCGKEASEGSCNSRASPSCSSNIRSAHCTDNPWQPSKAQQHTISLTCHPRLLSEDWRKVIVIIKPPNNWAVAFSEFVISYKLCFTFLPFSYDYFETVLLLHLYML